MISNHETSAPKYKSAFLARTIFCKWFLWLVVPLLVDCWVVSTAALTPFSKTSWITSFAPRDIIGGNVVYGTEGETLWVSSSRWYKIDCADCNKDHGDEKCKCTDRVVLRVEVLSGGDDFCSSYSIPSMEWLLPCPWIISSCCNGLLAVFVWVVEDDDVTTSSLFNSIAGRNQKTLPKSCHSSAIVLLNELSNWLQP